MRPEDAKDAPDDDEWSKLKKNEKLALLKIFLLKKGATNLCTHLELSSLTD